ncbi:MAG TPA: cupin domain-containing protein [Acidimicrobiia bacterium]|nr:cupin domain-containing protein [Acidimicrobiia bacterium]
MAGITKKSFDSADEVRSPDKTRMEVVDLGSAKAARLTAQPGWKWSECIKPVVGTDSCQARHVGAVLSGSLHVQHEDGTGSDFAPGDAYIIEPGHDAWVTSSEPFVAFEFESKTAAEYAKG